MPANAILTPFARGSARAVGESTFRKRLLPIGRITYEGQDVRFDRPFLQTLLKSWHQRAYDQVPFQLATADNKHNNDPERTRGEIVAMELADDGLYVTVSTTPEGAKVIRDNPKLGVSARIVNGLKRADDKFFTGAIQHVLGTLDPQINQLGPWEAIEASHQEDENVLDLSSIEYQEEQVPGRRGGRQSQPQLSDDELTRLRAILDEGAADDEGDGDGNEPDDELTPDELAQLLAAADEYDVQGGAGDEGEGGEGGLTEEELEAILAEDEELTPTEVAASSDPATQRALELANQRQHAQAIELARVTQALDDGRFEQERELFQRAYGIPPYIVDLAQPLLHGEGHVIELSNGSGAVDAGAVMRQVLTALGEEIKILDLSGELGSGNGPDETEAEMDERKNLVASYREQTGI